MIRALYTAATGMMAQQLQIDTTSNNIANVNTIGYKKQRAEFADLMYQTTEYPGTATSLTTSSPTGIEVGLGVRPSAITKEFTQGNFKKTGNNLDMAITGNGFFQVELPDGTTAYTRNGAFKLDANGFINPAGLHSLGSNNYINTSASGDAIVGTPGLNGIGEIREGFVELSNVQLVEEMTDLITGQRAYEANSKAITTSDQMLQTVNNLKR